MADTQQLSNTMRHNEFQKMKISQEANGSITDLKQGKTYDKYNSSQRQGINYRTKSTHQKSGKTAVGYKRRHLNPNNLFLRNQPPVEEYAQDPMNKFMKKPFLENLPMNQKKFYMNKKGFLNLFEDITKINLVFSEVIETVL